MDYKCSLIMSLNKKIVQLGFEIFLTLLIKFYCYKTWRNPLTMHLTNTCWHPCYPIAIGRRIKPELQQVFFFFFLLITITHPQSHSFLLFSFFTLWFIILVLLSTATSYSKLTTLLSKFQIRFVLLEKYVKITQKILKIEWNSYDDILL